MQLRHLHAFLLLLCAVPHTVTTLTTANIAPFERESSLELMARHPQLAQALCWLALQEEMIARDWLVNVGQRTALERLAHLLVRDLTRMQIVGLTDGERCELPHAAGATPTRPGFPVSGMLEIHDFSTLQSVAMFTSDYLHPGRERPARARRRFAPS